MKKTGPRKKKASDKVLENASLPTEKKEPIFNILEFIFLVYGREKIGKTTLLSSFEDTMFITTEPGTKGLVIFEFLDRPVKDWSEVLQAVELLEKDKKRFKLIVIDTADRAYDMCMDWVCEQRNIEYPGKDDDGKEDFGRSWRAVKQEFTDVIHRIIRTGRGVAFTSHMKETSLSSRSGLKYDRIYPSMGNQARAIIEALVDLYFFADYVRDMEGNTRRVLITEGDETIWAGHRKTQGKMPTFLPLLEENGFEVLEQAFRGEHPGIDPTELMIGKQTAGTTAKFIGGEQAKAAKKKMGARTKGGKRPAKKKRIRE